MRGDLSRSDDLAKALDGVERMYLFPVDDSLRECVGVVRERGVRCIVTLSSASVEGIEENFISRKQRAVEQAVEESEVEWTHVRPGAFAANALAWAPGLRAENVVRDPCGRAAQAPVHEADLAAVVAAAMTEEGHAGHVYTLTGPAAISQFDQVRAIAEVLGREVRFEELSSEQARRLWTGNGMPDVVADVLLGYLAAAADQPDTPQPTVEQIAGRPARTFAEWAADHADDFQGAEGAWVNA